MLSQSRNRSREHDAANLNVVETAMSLIPAISELASKTSETDKFVHENYRLLSESGLIEAGVPAELGGRGAQVPELSEMLKILARACGSTALAFAMHTHQVAIPAWRWRYQKVTAVESLLRRVSAERLVLLSSGGSDWIGGSGRAVKVDGGYRISARKSFTSGAEIGNLLMTGAVCETQDGAQSVIHFGAPMTAPEIKIENTWWALGMRGTGSNDVVIDDLFVPDSAVSFSRKAGEWHPVFEVIATIAFPLIYAVYLGVAESARDIAIDIVKRKPATEHQTALTGQMDTALRSAQLAHRYMIEVVERNSPSAETVNEVMIGRSLVAHNALKSVELSMELAGGAAFYRVNGLERRFRDIQGARYHPMQPGAQSQYAGAMALGQETAGIY